MLFSKNSIESVLCKFPKTYSKIRNFCGAEDWGKQVFLQLIKPEWTVVEIGANVGYYTSLFQKLVGPLGKVEAFEPLHTTFEILNDAISLFPANFQLYNLGASDVSGKVEFHLPVNDHGQATMTPHNSSTWKNREIKKVWGQVIQLDEFDPIQRLKTINFIKIDIEGAELLCLKGAKSIIRKHKPLVFLEVCKAWMKSFGYDAKELNEFLTSLGYSNFRVVGRKLVKVQSIQYYLEDKEEEASFNFLVS